MKGILMKDWSRFDYKAERHLKYLSECLQHFLDFATDSETTQALQHFATKDDFPGIIYDLIQKHHFLSYVDTAGESLFTMREFLEDGGPNTEGFSIGDIKSGLTFELIPDGQAVKVKKMAGTSARVTYNRYGGALGWPIELFKDRNWWQIEQNAIEFRNKYLKKKAQVIMALIENIATTNDVSWQNPDPAALPNTDANYTANKDMQTIQLACYNLLNLNKDKYDIGPETPLVLLAPLKLRNRMNRALGVLNVGVSSQHPGVDYNITPRYTLMLTTNQTDYYIGLPGLKNQFGMRETLTTYSDFDMLTRTAAAAGWARYGGAIGDVDQIIRCKSA